MFLLTNNLRKKERKKAERERERVGNWLCEKRLQLNALLIHPVHLRHLMLLVTKTTKTCLSLLLIVMEDWQKTPCCLRPCNLLYHLVMLPKLTLYCLFVCLCVGGSFLVLFDKNWREWQHFVLCWLNEIGEISRSHLVTPIWEAFFKFVKKKSLPVTLS